MPPTPIPALPSTSTSTTRSSVFRHVKRAQEGTDAPAIVLAVVCAILLLVVLLSVARYFHRIKCFFSLSSPRPRGRFTFSWLFPRRLVSLRTSNPTSRTPHSNPFPPRDPARPWSQYRPAYLRVYHPHRPYPYHSCRVAECRSDGLKVDLPGDRIPHRRIGFIIHLPGDLAAHHRQRPSSMRCPQVRTSASVPEVGHAPEITVTNDVNEVDVQILQQQNTLSIRAVACAPGIRTLEEVQIGHEVDSECDTAGDMAFESASRTAIPQARTDERRLGECEPSEARRDKYTGSVSLHSTFSDDDDSDVDGGSDDQEYGGNDADSDGENKPRSDSGESTYSVEQGRSAVPEVLEPQISPPVSFDDLADLYYFEDEEEEDAINRSYDFSLELVGSSNRPGSYLGIPGPAWFPPAVRFSPPVKVRLPCCRPLSPMRPPCHRSSFDQECANNEESQLPIVDKAGMDVGPLPDSIRASAWGRACQETLNAIVVTQAEAETEHQLPQLDLNSKTTNNLQKDTARHPNSDANHTRDVPNATTDNTTTIMIPEEKGRDESHDCDSPSKDADIDLNIVLQDLRYGFTFFSSDEHAKDDGSLVHGRCASILSLSSLSTTSGSFDSLASLSVRKRTDPCFHVTDPVSISPASVEFIEDEDEPAYLTILARTHRRTRALHVKHLEELVGCRRPSDDYSASRTTKGRCHTTSPRWAPVNGMIIIKVFVPATDDTWKVRVPEDITLQRFTSKVLSKLGFHVAFSGSCFDGPEYYFRTDDVFRCWVCKRIRHGRNLPIATHVIDPPAPSKMRRVDASSISKSANAVRPDRPFRYRDSLDILLGRISSIFRSPIDRFQR